MSRIYGKCQENMDNAVFGLNDAKMQIMQMIGQWISNPKSVGTAIAIQGPMGTGKTTLVKEGISKILNRPFAFLPLVARLIVHILKVIHIHMKVVYGVKL